MSAGDSDEDCRQLATGYLTRARGYLRRMETGKKGLPLQLVLLASLPLLIDGISDLGDSKKQPAAIAKMVLGCALAIYTKRAELSGSAAAKRARLSELISELEMIPAAGPLTVWHKQVVFDARLAMARFAEG